MPGGHTALIGGTSNLTREQRDMSREYKDKVDG